MLPLLEDVLGGGVAEALARTATALREDNDALDGLAAEILAELAAGGDRRRARHRGAGRRCRTAVRRRVIRGWLLAGGAVGLTDKQIRGVDALVTRLAGPGRGRGVQRSPPDAAVRGPPAGLLMLHREPV